VIKALATGTALRERFGRQFGFPLFAHSVGMQRHALEERSKLLRHYGAARAASIALCDARCQRLERNAAVVMIGKMLGAFGAKDDKDVLDGMLALVEGDEVSRAFGDEARLWSGADIDQPWLPLNVTPISLALACRKLSATSKFVPKPVELAKACRDAGARLRSAETFCDELMDYVRRCDALLLEFAPEQWRAPYLTPEVAPIVHDLLSDHAIYGNGDDEFYGEEPEEGYEEKEKNRAFREALDRAKLEFPKPEEPEIEQQPEQAKIAACTKPPAKKTHKPKPKGGK
jgi:hypothetical protein